MKELREYGLTYNDIKVYQSLLELGETKVGNVINHSQVVSSQVYESIKHLQDFGLLRYQVKNNVRYYTALDLSGLIDKTKDQMSALVELNEQVQQIKQTKSTKYDTNIYHGRRAFKKVMGEFITDPNLKELKVISYGGIDNFPKVLRAMFNEMDQSLIENKIKSKFLIDRETFQKAQKDRGKQLNQFQIKFLDKSYFGPTAYDISRDRVLLSVWGKEPIVIEIGNRAVVESYNNNFDFLWSIAEKK